MRRRSPLQITWALATIAGASVVGVTTHQPGFVVITFIGGLLLPRVLGFGGHHHPHGFGPGAWHCGRHRDAAAAEEKAAAQA